MYRWCCLALVCAMVPVSAVAQERVALTFEEALRLAAQRAPASVVADAATQVARADLVAARLSAAHNPALEVGAGPRFAETTSLDFEVGLEQEFALGGRRSAAVAVAEAGIAVAGLEADAIRREAVEAAAAEYLRAAHARGRLQIAQQSVALARVVVEMAEKRYAAGETDLLEVNTARVALGRHAVEVQVWEGRLEHSLGELSVTLGLPGATPVELRSPLEQGALPDLVVLLQAAQNRPELEALRAAGAREAARLELADALGWPEIGAGVGYGFEEGAHIVTASLRFTLPFFVRGQALTARASAVAEAREQELAALSAATVTELQAQYRQYQTLRAAEVAFRNEVIPVLEKNESMIETAYREGSLDLPELLAMRREMIEARERYVDLLLNVALVTTRVRALSNTLYPKETQ